MGKNSRRRGRFSIGIIVFSKVKERNRGLLYV
jgi:hypothetical protein